MSWSVYKTGSKDKVRAACEAELDKQAKGYAGQEEEKDVLMAKDRVLSAIDSLDMKADTYAPEGYGVAVAAAGSRSGYTVNITVDVKRVHLLV